MEPKQLSERITELWISKAINQGTVEGLARSVCEIVNSAVSDYMRAATPLDSLVVRVLRDPPVSKIDLAIAGLQHLKQIMSKAAQTMEEKPADPAPSVGNATTETGP